MNKKKVLIAAGILATVAGLIAFFPIKKSIEKERALAAAYEQGLSLIEAGEWKQAYRVLDAYVLREYRDAKNLAQYCYARDLFENGQIQDARVRMKRVGATDIYQEDIAWLHQQIEDNIEAYWEKQRQEKERIRQEAKTKAQRGVPYVGMLEEWIGITTLGKPSDAFEQTVTKGTDTYKAHIYRFRNSQGEVIFVARCERGMVVEASDDRASPWGGHAKKPAYDPDPYGAKNYSHPDDFYYDHYDDFFDFEDAEDYYYEHCS